MESDPSESPIIIARDEANNKAARKKQQDARKTKPPPSKPAIDPEAFLRFFRRIGAEQLHGQLDLQEGTRAFIKENIVPLNNKHVHTFSTAFRESLIHDEWIRFQLQPSVESFAESLGIYCRLNAIYRECSVNSPILTATYQEFQALWLRQLKNFCEKDELEAKQRLIAIWKDVPYQVLKPFLSAFHLQGHFQDLNPEQFLKILVNDLFEGRTQQVVQYYSLFSNHQLHKHSDFLRKFEEEQLIPRLTKKDQLFTDYVVALIKQNRSLADKIYAVIELQQEQKLMGLAGDDIAHHPRVLTRAMRRHYNDVVFKCKHWYIIEDKLSFSRIFTQWYASQLTEGREKHGSQSQGEEKLDPHKQFVSQEERIVVAGSILARLNGNLTKQILRNPLYHNDAFMAAQLVMQDAKLTTTTWKYDDFLTLNEQNVVFVGQLNESFLQAEKKLLSCQIVGFDSEFVPTESKFSEEGGVSIIQLSTPDKTFIFDYMRLRSNPNFIDFFITLMESPQIIKVGHTFSSDLQYLYKNFPKGLHPTGIVDIAKLFKELYPQECYSSLAYLTQKFLQKQLCKYEQRSNWARRPLKKTQLYYAALDAHVCLAIFKHLNQNSDISPSNIQSMVPRKLSQGKLQEQKVALEFDFQKYAELVKDPKFLVDNMLKKLSSTMRNCGLDAEFISVKDHELALTQAKKQKRIIITRDGKLAQRKGQVSPIYLLKQRSDTELMFQELISSFHIDLSKYKTLSRCVKCNCDELLVISCEEAQGEIKFLYENNIREYWRCARCRQIYWEGGQFTKAKNKYEALRNNTHS